MFVIYSKGGISIKQFGIVTSQHTNYFCFQKAIFYIDGLFLFL